MIQRFSGSGKQAQAEAPNTTYILPNLLWGRASALRVELPLGASAGETEIEHVEMAVFFASKRRAEARGQSESSAPPLRLGKCKWYCAEAPAARRHD
jgi:hypothetical protein